MVHHMQGNKSPINSWLLIKNSWGQKAVGWNPNCIHLLCLEAVSSATVSFNLGSLGCAIFCLVCRGPWEWMLKLLPCISFLIFVQLLRHVQLFATPWTAARQASLSITISWSLLKFMSIESVMPSNHLVLCGPLLLLPFIFHSIRVFSIELVLLIRWPKYWSFSFSISPSNEYSGLISFSITWFDLLAVQGTHKSLLQHHRSKAWILQCSAFFYFLTSYFSVFSFLRGTVF